MEDLRSERRNHLVYYLRVFEQDGKTLFGHVVDLSPNGMLITGNRPIPQHSVHTLYIEDNIFAEDLSMTRIEAECRWCRHDSGLYDAGFQIMSKVRECAHLMEEYA